MVQDTEKKQPPTKSLNTFYDSTENKFRFLFHIPFNVQWNHQSNTHSNAIMCVKWVRLCVGII